jgi:hypothetical protein
VVEITGWHGGMTPRDYAALTPLIREQVNPYRRFEPRHERSAGAAVIEMAAGDTTLGLPVNAVFGSVTPGDPITARFTGELVLRLTTLWWRFGVPHDVPCAPVPEETVLLAVLQFSFRVRTQSWLACFLSCA